MARRASGDVLNRFAALGVGQDGGSLAVAAMGVAPLHERNQDRGQVSSGIGEPILEALWPFLVPDLLEDALFDESTKSGGQQVRRDADLVSEVAEPVDPSKHGSQDQQRPTVANRVESGQDRVSLGGVSRGHEHTVGEVSCKMQLTSIPGRLSEHALPSERVRQGGRAVMFGQRKHAVSLVIAVAMSTALAVPAAAQDAVVICDGRVATIVGTSGSDRLTGTSGSDVIAALQGNDVIHGLDGDDIICAGKGNDVVFGGPGFDVIFGAQGDDGLFASSGPFERDRDDTAGGRIFGGLGDDLIHGSNRWDRIQGGPGEDIIFGYGGRDWIRGGADADDLSGGANIDNVHGGDGDDRIAIAGSDTVRGGAGSDTCVLESEPALLRSCGRNRAEPTPSDGRSQFMAGTYSTPSEVPFGLYRTTRSWSVSNDDGRTIRAERQFDNSPTLAFVHPQGVTATFLADAQRIDASTPALDPFEFSQGRFIVGLDLAPGTYRVVNPGPAPARAATFTARGQVIETFVDDNAVVIYVGPEAASFSFVGTLTRQ